MKVFNIITSIIILLLAITSAVFSYFLYEKRVQFVDGWNQMSDAIHKSAKNIDQEGVNKYADKLKPEILSHKEYTQEGLSRNLTNLTKQSKEFVEQYTNAMAGWKAMSEAISAGSANIEKSFKKGYAAKVSEDALKFDGATFAEDEFKEKIKAFSDQNREFVKEYDALKLGLARMTADRDKWKSNFEVTKRNLDAKSAELSRRMGQIDNMAGTLATIGSRTNANTGAKADFVNLATYSGRLSRIGAAVNNLINTREGVIKEIERIARVKIDRNLIFSNVNKGIKPLENIFNSHKTARQHYAGAVSNIATRLKVAFKDDLTKNYTSTAAVVTATNTELAKIPSLQNQLAKANREIGSLKNTNSARDKEIARLNGVIGDYKTILDLKPSDADPKVWARGSADARKVVVGTVTKVSEKYGYIVLDFGSDTNVTQVVGNKKLLINPDLESGLVFNVTRDGKFVAAVTLSNIGAKESTAHIPADKAGTIKVGDKATFFTK